MTTDGAHPVPLRRAIKAVRATLAPLWAHLLRLNSMGVRGGGSRATRSAAFRSVLSQKYRDRSPCC